MRRRLQAPSTLSFASIPSGKMRLSKSLHRDIDGQTYKRDAADTCRDESTWDGRSNRALRVAEREISFGTDLRKRNCISPYVTEEAKLAMTLGILPSVVRVTAKYITYTVAILFFLCGGWALALLAWIVLAVRHLATRYTEMSACPHTSSRHRPRPTITCVVCRDVVRGEAPVHVPCGHDYHQDCMTRLFEAATRDEALFPPRCCGQLIALKSVRRCIPPAVLARFLARAHELRVPNRVYCRCGRFLGRKDERLSARAFRCPARGCRTRTCARCKRRVEGFEHECEPDRADAGILELGRRSGWARCPGCEHLVELERGCFHMTCRCRTEFCYLCQALWKTCACPQWAEQSRL